MKFTNLTAEEFGAFTDDMPYSHSTQTIGHYELKLAEGYETHLVGIKSSNNKVIAACLLTAVPVMEVFEYFYSNRGPVIDYENQELVHFFFNELSKHIKRHHCLYLHIDPYLPHQYLSRDGETTGSAGNGRSFDKVGSLGFEHTEFHKGFNPVLQVRYHSVLDLKDKTADDIIKNTDGLRKRNTKKVKRNSVRARFLSEEELPIFRSFMEDTSESKALADRDDKFYYSRLRYYKDRVLVPLARISFDEYIKELSGERDILNKDSNKALKDTEKRPENKKAHSKRDNLQQRLDTNEQKIEEGKRLQGEHDNELPISAGFFFINPFEAVYYAGGISNALRHFTGGYAVQWEVINYTLNHGIDHYNFYGVSNKFTRDAENAGVVKFEEGYSAEITEYVGDFIKPVNKPVYATYTALKKVKDRIL